MVKLVSLLNSEWLIKMQTTNNQQPAALPATSSTLNPRTYCPLQQVTRPTVPTNSAAFYLNRKPQTLRMWACLENGPIRPIRINRRLAWSVAEIKTLLQIS